MHQSNQVRTLPGCLQSSLTYTCVTSFIARSHPPHLCAARLCSEDDSYAKAYFRRAVVAACLGEYESARGDLAICAELDESTAEECEQELQRMERQEQAAEAKTRDALKGFFNR